MWSWGGRGKTVGFQRPFERADRAAGRAVSVFHALRAAVLSGPGHLGARFAAFARRALDAGAGLAGGALHG